LSAGEFIRWANSWGRRRCPFLFVIDYELRRFRAWPLDDVPSGVRFQVRGISNVSGAPSDPIRILQRHPVAFDRYWQAFQQAQYHLQRGDTYLLNLTFPTEIVTTGGLRQIFDGAFAPYKLWMSGEMVVFSPECFIRITDNVIRTFPMKGTADASDPGSRAALLANAKEEWEHATVVDLLRNDLSMVAMHVRLRRYRYISEVRSAEGRLWQVSSEIEGILPSHWHNHVGELLIRLLPAGSISGAPKARTVEIIRRLEGQPRKWFTGIFGVYDGQGLDSAVMIRFVERCSDGRLWFRSGGGITAWSDVRLEYEEMIRKVYLPVSPT